MNLGNDKKEEELASEQYGVNLTSKARGGKLDPVIGRDSVRKNFHTKCCVFGTCPDVYSSVNMIQGS